MMTTISTSALWWLASGLAVAIEVATGTFYLLMIGLGMVAGALASHLGLGAAGQLIAAAVVGGGATALLHWRRLGQAPAIDSRRNRDVNLDIGERIEVARWSGDDTASVQYRGSVWTARRAPGAPPVAGAHRVVAVEGNWLVLAPMETP